MIRSKRNLSTGMWPVSQMRNPSFSEGMNPDPHQYVMRYSNQYLEPHILTGLPLPNEPEEIGNAKIGENCSISYSDDGRSFLLSIIKEIRCNTMSQTTKSS